MSDSNKVRSHLRAAESSIRQFAQVVASGDAMNNSGQVAYKAVTEILQALELMNSRLDALEARAAED